MARLVVPPRALLGVALAICLLAGPIAVWTFTARIGLPDLAPAHAGAAGVLVSLWGPRGLASRRVRWGAVAAAVCIALGDLAVGRSFAPALWSGIANVLVAITAVGVVAGRYREPSWCPPTPAACLRLVVASVAATGVGALTGAFEGAPLGGEADTALRLWAAERGFLLLVVLFTAILPIVYVLPGEHAGMRFRPLSPLLLVTAGVCSAVPYVAHDAGLAWLVVVPAVWAGMTLSIRQAAFLAFTIAVCQIPVPYREMPGDYPFHPEMLVDLLVGVITLTTLVLVVLREQHGRMMDRMESHAERERAHRSLLANVVDSIADGLIIHDGRRIHLANAVATGSFGTEVPQVLGQEWITRLGVRQEEGGAILTLDELHRLLRPAPRPRAVDLVAQGVADEPQRLRFTSHPLRFGDAGLSMLVFKDTTLEHARQKELERFAGTVAHDLKSPLTGLRGWLEAAGEEVDDGEAAGGLAAVRRARDATARMNSLIDDLLAYTISQQGVLRLVDVPLEPLVGELSALYESAGTDGAVFEVEAAHVVHADPALARQLLANLVGNAVKYSRPGVPAHLHITSRGAEPGWVEVSIADRGRGLQAGDEQRIFEAFGRSAKDASSVQGIGLGLALCHAIVTRHGGEISAGNNDQGGATFTFTLPAAA